MQGDCGRNRERAKNRAEETIVREELVRVEVQDHAYDCFAPKDLEETNVKQHVRKKIWIMKRTDCLSRVKMSDVVYGKQVRRLNEI